MNGFFWWGVGVFAVVAVVYTLIGVLAPRSTGKQAPEETGGPVRDRLKSTWEECRGTVGRIVAVLLIWGISNIAFYLLLPDAWKWWYDQQNFFWGTQIVLLTLLLMQAVFKNEKNKPAINLLTGLLIGMFVVGTYLQVQGDPQIQAYFESAEPTRVNLTAETKSTNPCGEPKVVVARRGNPITVHGRGKKCRWDIRRDRSAGEENYLAAVEMRPNGSRKNAQIDGLVDDEYRNPAFSMSVDFFEIEPITAPEVRLVVGFVPTN